MMSKFLIVALSFLSTAALASGYTCTDYGDGITICRLEVVQDVSLESGTTNYDYLEYLLLAKHPGYPLKRSLLQFEDLPAASGCSVKDAYMYVNFAYAHKASSQSVDDAPYYTHEAQLHVVNEEWLEDEATSTYRKSGVPWTEGYLALDGTDADSTVQSSATLRTAAPSRFVEFKVTSAVEDWTSGAVGNNGLLMKVQDETLEGRDMRFYSNAHSDSSKHAYINVVCN